jgi:hypothetical protein
MTSRRKITLSRMSEWYPVQKEDPKLTPEQKQAISQMTWELCFLPILRGEASIRDCITTPRGWERLEAVQPNLTEIPIVRQLAIAPHE